MPFLGGGSATSALVTPPSNLNGTFSTALGWVLTWTNGLLSQGTRVYRTDSEELAEQPTSPFNKVRVTPVAVSGTTFIDKFEPRPGVTYVYYLCSLDILGNESAQVSFTAVTPNVPQNHLNLWTHNLTKTATSDGGTTVNGWFHWKGDAGVTAVAGTGGNAGATTVTFTNIDQGFYQTVSTYNLSRTNATYTVYIKVKGNVGETFQIFAHGVLEDGSGTPVTGTTWNSSNLTLTGGVDEFTVTRPAFATGARYMRFGIQTYNSQTARVLNVYELRLADGTLTQAQMQASSAVVQGPGTTWHQPIKPTINVTLTGLWFRTRETTTTSNVPPIQIGNDNVSLTLNACRTESNRAAHVQGGGKGGFKITCTDHRFYGKADSGVQGVPRAYIYQGDFAAHLVFEHFYAYRTAGFTAQYFRGLASSTNTFRVRYYFYRELDGKNYNSDGTPVRNTWGGANLGQGPTSLAAGCIVANAVGLRQLDGTGSNGSSGGTNPNGEGIRAGEHSYGVIYARPGYSKFEDLYNYAGVRGEATSPFRTHDIMVIGVPSHDFYFHEGLTTTYNMGRQLCSYTQSITTSASVTGTGSATTISVNALSGPVPLNQNFTLNGLTLQASSTAGRGSTSISVKAFTGTIPSGTTGSGSFVWGPDIVSSTGGLSADFVSGSVWEVQAAYQEVYNILAIGPELPISDQKPGNDRNIYSCEVWMPTTLLDGTTAISAVSRNYGFQNTVDNSTYTDKNTVAQAAIQNVNFFNVKTVGGGSTAFLSGGYPSYKTTGHVITAAPTAAQCWARAQRFLDDVVAAGVTLGPTV